MVKQKTTQKTNMNSQIQAQAIRQAIEDCNRYIEKEEPRASDLRPTDVAKRLEFYKAHRAKLLGMPKAAA
jgi:hypothetical protein